MAQTGKPQFVRMGAQCQDHSAHLAAVPFRRFYTDARVFAQTQLLVTEYYGFDAPNDSWDMYNIEAEAMGQQMIYSSHAMPDIDRMNPLIQDASSLDHIKPPDPYKSGRMPWVHQINKLYLELIGRPARVFFCAPFSLAMNIRGYISFVRDMKTNPSFAHRLLSFLCDEVLVPYIQAMRHEIGQAQHIAFGADAWASPPNLSLDMMDEYVVPYTERLRKAAGDPLITFGYWGEARCHDADRFMAQKLKVCPIFLNILDPDLYEIGPEWARDFARRHNLLISAGIDAALIMDGPIPSIVDRIRYYIDVMARTGRLMLYLNQIPVDTPPQHVHAAVAAVHTYGRLPLPDHLEALELDIPERETFSEFLNRKGARIDV